MTVYGRYIKYGLKCHAHISSAPLLRLYFSLPGNSANLERICSFLHERIVSNDNVVQWEGRRFQISPQHRRFSFAGAKVQLYQGLDGRVSLYYGDTRLEHTNTRGG